VRARPLAALATLVLVASGCASGTGGVEAQGDVSHGKTLFLNGENGKPACAACHTLAEAGSSGKVGPNLDDAFGSDRAQGFKESTIRQVVADQIRFAGNYGSSGPTMPKNLVTGENVAAVASYVALVAGQKGVHVSAAAAPAPTTTAPAPSGGGGANLAAGKAAFSTNTCNACHTLAAAGATGKIGPDLDKLKSYAQKAGMPLDQFIRESIVKPNAYIEKGFPPNVMPQNFGSLPKATLDALVAFLAASAK
jgi:cytochrome c2